MKRKGVRLGAKIDRRPKPPVKYVNDDKKFILCWRRENLDFNFMRSATNMNIGYLTRCLHKL